MISGEEFEKVILEGDAVRSLQVLTDLKTHIKRYLVDLNEVPSYILGLKEAYRQSAALQITAFTTLCHLVTRISMQDPSQLANFSHLLIPFLLEKLLDTRNAVAQTTKKSIKTFWSCVTSSDDQFIDLIYQKGFRSNELKIRADILDVLGDLLQDNMGFSFKSYIGFTVELLNDSNHLVSTKAFNVLTIFFQKVNPNSKSAKLDLINLLKQYAVKDSIVTKLLQQIGGFDLVEGYQNYNEVNDSHENNDISMMDEEGVDEHLNSLLSKVPFWISYDTIKPLTIDYTYLEELEEKILPFFTGKETEVNWKARQDWLIKLRCMLRYVDINSTLIEPLVELIKQTRECIVKGLLSLRTTLSNNACQLCKELGIYLGQYLDSSTLEVLFNTLVKLCVSRKTIQNQNANTGVIGLLLNCNLTPKLFNYLILTMQEKNVQPKVYVGQWIHLLLIRYYGSEELFDRILELIEPLMIKGVSDSQPPVRESMRKSFWCLNELMPNAAERIKEKLDLNSLKALDKSKTSLQPRQSIKELINEKRRQTQRETFKHQKEKLLSSDLVEREILRESNKRSISLGTADILDHKKPNKTQQQIQQRSQSLGKPKEDYEDFTERLKKQNFIYEQIISNSSEEQEIGFSKLLKLSDSNDEEQLSYKFQAALNDLSYINPSIFWKIFQNERWFKLISSYMATENLIRVYCIHFVESGLPERDEIDLILNSLKIEDISLGIKSIFEKCCDTSKIDDLKLSIQFNKYKQQIMNIILFILRDLIIFKKDKLKVYMLGSLFESIFRCDTIIQPNSETLFDEIINLCYKNWEIEFLRVLSFFEEDRQMHIKNILGIKNEQNENLEIQHQLRSSFSKSEDEYDAGNLEHMTRVIPKAEDLKELIAQQQQEPHEDFTKVIPFITQGWKDEAEEAEQENKFNAKDVFESIDEQDEPMMIIEKETDEHKDEKMEEEEEEEEKEEEEEENKSDSTPNLETLDINQSSSEISEDRISLVDNWRREIELSGKEHEDLTTLEEEELIEKLKETDREAVILVLLDKCMNGWPSEKLIELIKIKERWSDIGYFLLQEIINRHDIKVASLVNKFPAEYVQYHELILDKIFGIIQDGLFDGEDVFLIERFLNKGIKHDNDNIRMKSMIIYGQLYQIHVKGDKDSNGYDLVDEILFKDLNLDFIKGICNLYL